MSHLPIALVAAQYPDRYQGIHDRTAADTETHRTDMAMRAIVRSLRMYTHALQHTAPFRTSGRRVVIGFTFGCFDGAAAAVVFCFVSLSDRHAVPKFRVFKPNPNTSLGDLMRLEMNDPWEFPSFSSLCNNYQISACMDIHTPCRLSEHSITRGPRREPNAPQTSL
jgi:hypothetical protein